MKGIKVTKTDKAFMRWLKQNGANISDKIVFGSVEAFGKGVFVNRNVNRSEVYAEIPQELILTRSTAKQHLKAIRDRLFFPPLHYFYFDLEVRHELELDTQTIFASLLLWYESMQPDSFWRPYLDTLPKTVDSAILYTNEELSLFQESQPYHFSESESTSYRLEDFEAISKVAKRDRQSLKNVWKVLEPLLLLFQLECPHNNKPSSCYNYDDFVMWMALVRSRSILISGNQHAIVPLGDKLNHGPIFKHNMTEQIKAGRSNPVHHLYNDTHVALSADRDTRKGTQLLEQYSNGPNAFFILYAGFVPNVNYGHLVTVPLPSLSEKAQLLALQLEVPVYNRAHIQSTTKVFDPGVWSYLELSLLKPSYVDVCLLYARHLQREQVCEYVPIACGESLVASTAAMHHILQASAQTALSHYATTLQQDEQLLQSWMELPSGTVRDHVQREHAILAIRYRMINKELLYNITQEEIVPDRNWGQPERDVWNMVIVAGLVVLYTMWYYR